MGSLAEVFDFILHERADVRKMAVESVAGICMDEKIISELAQNPAFILKLVQLLDDQPIIAATSWKVLINISKDQRVAANLYDHIPKIISQICNKDNAFGDYACMLLSNTSKAPACQTAIALHLPKIFPIFIEGPQHNPKASCDFLAGVIADVTQSKEGRLFFLGDSLSPFFQLVKECMSSKLIRRGGAVTAVKNCLFETEEHQRILDYDEEDESLLGSLLGLLAGPDSKFDEEELDQMILDVQLEHRHSPIESDLAIRTYIIESLILLCTNLSGRNILREKHAYPILREAHRLEEEDALKALMEKLVEYLIRDEDTTQEAERSLTY